MTEHRIVKPTSPVIALTLAVECPHCGSQVKYEPVEDDAGSFVCVEEWPVCEPCETVIDVPPLRFVPVASTYFADRQILGRQGRGARRK